MQHVYSTGRRQAKMQNQTRLIRIRDIYPTKTRLRLRTRTRIANMVLLDLPRKLRVDVWQQRLSSSATQKVCARKAVCRRVLAFGQARCPSARAEKEKEVRMRAHHGFAVQCSSVIRRVRIAVHACEPPSWKKGANWDRTGVTGANFDFGLASSII